VRCEISSAWPLLKAAFDVSSGGRSIDILRQGRRSHALTARAWAAEDRSHNLLVLVRLSITFCVLRPIVVVTRVDPGCRARRSWCMLSGDGLRAAAPWALAGPVFVRMWSALI
jgi:hypothetical protein